MKPRSALLDGSIHRLVRSIKPRSVFVKSTEGWNVFVSRSAFVTSARAKPEGLARMPSSRPKPPGFEPGDDVSRANRACAMSVRSVRGQGAWGPAPTSPRLWGYGGLSPPHPDFAFPLRSPFAFLASKPQPPRRANACRRSFRRKVRKESDAKFAKAFTTAHLEMGPCPIRLGAWGPVPA